MSGDEEELDLDEPEEGEDMGIEEESEDDDSDLEVFDEDGEGEGEGDEADSEDEVGEGDEAVEGEGDEVAGDLENGDEVDAEDDELPEVMDEGEGEEDEAAESKSSTKAAKVKTAKAPAKKVKKVVKFKVRSISAEEGDLDELDTDGANDDRDPDVDEDQDIGEGFQGDSEDEDLDIDATDTIDEDEEGASDNIDVSHSSAVAGRSQWTAFYKGIPVAIATAATAGRNADIFDTQDFGRAVVISAKHAGIKNTLREMGFRPIVTTVALSQVLNKKVKAKVVEVKKTMKKSQQEHAERLQASLATAAVGLTRGFFVDQDNPLKASLHKALSDAGVRNPEVMIHNAFKTSADSYHKVLFAKAQDIMSKPAAVQESLAKAILETNYQESSTSGTNQTEERLSNMGTTVNAKPKASTSTETQESTSAAGDFSERLARVVGSLGRRA
jgi:hypothetical protein